MNIVHFFFQIKHKMRLSHFLWVSIYQGQLDLTTFKLFIFNFTVTRVRLAGYKSKNVLSTRKKNKKKTLFHKRLDYKCSTLLLQTALETFLSKRYLPETKNENEKKNKIKHVKPTNTIAKCSSYLFLEVIYFPCNIALHKY